MIDKTILSLSSNPRPYGSKKLTEKEGYRIRAGNYRILYTVDDKAKVIVIYRIKIKGKSTYK
jgi:mRNA interferase RelE/StbE